MKVTRKLSAIMLAISFHFGTVACSGDEQQMEEEVQQGAQEQGEASQQNVSNGALNNGGNAESQEQQGQQVADQQGSQEGEENYNPEQGNLENDQLAQNGEEEGQEDEQGEQGEQGENLGEADDMGNEAGDEDLQAILNEVNNDGGGSQNEEVVEDMTNQAEGQGGNEAIAANNAPANGGNAPAQEAPVEGEGNFVAEQAAPANNAMPANASANTTSTSAPAVAGSLPENGTMMAYVVVKGDTLGKIASRIYGTPSRYKDIQGAADQNRIYPGDVVWYSLDDASKAFAQRYENAPMTSVAAQAGDSLHKIAQSVYGSATAWVYLWRFNGQIDNPDSIKAGESIHYVSMDQLQAMVKSLDAKIVAAKNAKLAKKSA